MFADPHQLDEYKKNIEKVLGVNVVEGRRGVREQRNLIMQYFPVGSRIIEMDDDIEDIVAMKDPDKNAKLIKVSRWT